MAGMLPTRSGQFSRTPWPPFVAVTVRTLFLEWRRISLPGSVFSVMSLCPVQPPKNVSCLSLMLALQWESETAPVGTNCAQFLTAPRERFLLPLLTSPSSGCTAFITVSTKVRKPLSETLGGWWLDFPASPPSPSPCLSHLHSLKWFPLSSFPAWHLGETGGCH